MSTSNSDKPDQAGSNQNPSRAADPLAPRPLGLSNTDGPPMTLMVVISAVGLGLVLFCALGMFLSSRKTPSGGTAAAIKAGITPANQFAGAVWQVKYQIDALAISAETKKAFTNEIERLEKAVNSRKVDPQVANEALNRFTGGTLMTVAALEDMIETHVKPSDLTDAQKDQAVRALQRLARGVSSQQLNSYLATDVLSPTHSTDPYGQVTMKTALSTDELLAVVAAAKKLADEQGLADEPFELDVVGVLRGAVDDALGVVPEPEPVNKPAPETKMPDTSGG